MTVRVFDQFTIWKQTLLLQFHHTFESSKVNGKITISLVITIARLITNWESVSDTKEQFCRKKKCLYLISERFPFTCQINLIFKFNEISNFRTLKSLNILNLWKRYYRSNIFYQKWKVVLTYKEKRSIYNLHIIKFSKEKKVAFIIPTAYHLDIVLTYIDIFPLWIIFYWVEF